MCCASSKTFRVDRNTFRFSDQCPRVNIWVKMLSEQCCGCGMLWLQRKLVSGSRSNSRTHAWSSENVLACSTSRSSYAHGRSSTVLSTWYDDTSTCCRAPAWAWACYACVSQRHRPAAAEAGAYDTSHQCHAGRHHRPTDGLRLFSLENTVECDAYTAVTRSSWSTRQIHGSQKTGLF